MIVKRESGIAIAKRMLFVLGPARVTTVKPLGLRRVRSPGKRIASVFGTSGGLKKARAGIVCVSVREAEPEMRKLAMGSNLSGCN